MQLAFWAILGVGALMVWQVGPQKVLDAVVMFYQELQATKGEAEGGMKRGRAEMLGGSNGGSGGYGYGMGSRNAGTGWK